MKKAIIYILVFVIGGIAGGFGLSWYQIFDKTTSKSVDSSKTKIENQFILEKDVAVYLPWWDQDNGFESIKENKDKISHIKAFWYQIKKDGTIRKYTGAGNKEIIKFAKTNNIKILPVINSAHEPENVELIFTDAKARSKHINDILELILLNEYDGIEIDYESMDGENQKEGFSTFIKELSTVLKNNSKTLAVAVHAKTTDGGAWEGPAAQDWKVLNQYCDQIKIMTYDYSWSTSEAGNIAPLSWMKEVLNYAITVLDKDKIYLGIHFYGYDWLEEQGRDVVYADVLELIDEYSPTISTSKEQEKNFTYTDEEDERTVYFADHETIKPRLKLVNEYNIAGIGIWSLGQEDPKNWQSIADTL